VGYRFFGPLCIYVPKIMKVDRK